MRETGKVVDIALVKQACSNCSLQELCLPVGVDRDDVERLDAIVRRRRPLSGGSHVFRLGDEFRALYAIRSGSVKTYTLSEDGGERVTGFHLPGELIGLDAIGSGRHACAARTLETTALCELTFERLEELAILVPGLGRQLLRILSREIDADSQLLILPGKPAEARLASLLLSLSARLRQRGFSGREFRLSMSRSDIGNYLGLAVETVSRLFTRFRRQGLIAVNNKLVRLDDVDGLRRLAGISGFSDSSSARV